MNIHLVYNMKQNKHMKIEPTIPIINQAYSQAHIEISTKLSVIFC